MNAGQMKQMSESQPMHPIKTTYNHQSFMRFLIYIPTERFECGDQIMTVYKFFS